MRQEDFNLFASILRQRSGFHLSPDKSYLLESRLLPVTRKWHVKSVDDLAVAIRTKPNEAMLIDITEAMSMNESSFFRDQKPFTVFRKSVLPQIVERRQTKKLIRIWSAACSSGQETYSLAMQCEEEYAKLQGWRVDIVGTDISKEMISRAKSGVYSQLEVQRGLPIVMLLKYFQQIGDKWEINERTRQMVHFSESNLLNDFHALGVFDIIFCRYVLSNFDPNNKKRILDCLKASLAPDGVLFLGKDETVTGLSNDFKPAPPDHDYFILDQKISNKTK